MANNRLAPKAEAESIVYFFHKNRSKIAMPTQNTANAYATAQSAIANLKFAVYMLLQEAGPEGMRNVDIGRALGIYSGHARHEGHIPRTLLAIMESEGVVEQLRDARWRLIEVY